MNEAEQLANAIKGRTLLVTGRTLNFGIKKMEYSNPVLILLLEIKPTECSVTDIVKAIEKAKTVKLYAVEQNAE